MNLLQPDLFSFAYVPSWYCQLDGLAELVRPEPWRFREPIYSTKNPDTPILERYIHAIFKKQAIDYNEEKARRTQRGISMWRMNTPASIPACIQNGTRRSMPALTGTSGRPVCWMWVTMKLYASGEDYLEAILMLQKKTGMVRSVDFARHMGFSKPSISHVMGVLRGGGFLTVDEDGFLHLTDTDRDLFL